MGMATIPKINTTLHSMSIAKIFVLEIQKDNCENIVKGKIFISE
jgi:hypothetical protein